MAKHERLDKLNCSGSTLVETSIGLAVLGLVFATAFSAFSLFQSVTLPAEQRSNTREQAKLALTQIDRHVRSGNVLYDPATESSPGLSLRIYTQANGTQRCVTWRIESRQLQVRSWSPVWRTDGEVSGWRSVATDIDNTSLQPVFILNQTGNFGSRLIDVDLTVRVVGSNAQAVRVKTSIAGRNTSYGYGAGVCNDIPPGA